MTDFQKAVLAPRLLVLLGATLIIMKVYGDITFLPDPLQTLIGGILGLGGAIWFVMSYAKHRKRSKATE